MTAFSLKAQYSEDDLLSEANALFDKQAYGEAMPLYAQLLSLHSTKPEYNFKYGATALYGDADKKEEAIKFLKYASTKNGIDPECWYFLGRAYHLNYQFADAINAYNKYKELGPKKGVAERNVDREIEDCRNGQNLLANIKEVTVLTKNKSQAESFFRIYDLSDIGGKILVTPDALLSKLDKERNHQSLILFRGTGTTVYFSSYGKDGKNGLDIYQANVLPDGEFSTPKALGPEINTPFDEDYPFLHPDNKTFYFSSKGHSSMGGYDIFQADFNPSSGTFSQPKNLDFAINTPDDDLFYVADSAKKMANFASARRSKQGELDVYKVLVKSAPAEITLVKGSFANEIDPGNRLAKITVVEASSNSQIDVQFTDPNSGDYVLSFPRSGRFKFSVEVQNSTQIHSGVVDIPKSSGVTAYLQEMELVSNAGVEKLIINNLFDQKYDGDVSALAQKLLRQRAALDVNFNVTEEAPEEPVVVQTDASNIDMAYNAAGFGAGMSNAKVLEISKTRSDKIGEQAEHIADLKVAVQDKYFELLAEANAKAATAADLIERANGLSGDERSKLMFQAGIAKMKAENAMEVAQNSRELIDELTIQQNSAGEEYRESKAQSDELAEALNSGDYDVALEALQKEREIEESIDKSVVKNDPVNEIQKQRSQTSAEANKYQNRAAALRKQTDDMQARLLTKNRQLETSKGKERDRIETEIANLNSEIEDSERRTDKAFAQANEAQQVAMKKAQQYKLLTSLDEEPIPEKELANPNDQPVEVTDTEFNETTAEISKLKIDPTAVAQYMQANPNEELGFDNEMTAMSFKKEYAPDAVDDLADNSNIDGDVANNESTSSTHGNEDEIADAGSEHSSENHAGSNAQNSENSISTAKPNDNPDNSAQVLTGTGVAVTAAVLSDTNESNTDKTSHTTSVEATTKPSEIAENSAEKPNNEVNTEEDQLDHSSGATAQNTIAENTELVADESSQVTEPGTSVSEPVEAIATESAEIDYSTLTPYEVDKKIDAENAKISAAEDWMNIINSSVADLEKEAKAKGTLNDPDTKAQLIQYKELLATKEQEVAESEAVISNIQKVTSSAKPNAADAVAIAEADIDTLSPSLIGRLEMKSNESATDLNTIRDVREVVSDYQSELVAIELSGLSDPELAGKRIALNEKFITEAETKLRKTGETELPKDRLLELRRMKAIEIQQDQRVQIGEKPFEPLTSEARQYKEMLTANTKSESDTDIPKTENSALSPELTKELNTPFSPDLVMEGYAARLTDIDSEQSDSLRLVQKIDLNKNYLNDLRSEIAMYQAALENTESNGENTALEDRYNLLLSQRSVVVDEITTDQVQLEAMQTTASVGEVELAENETPSVVIADDIAAVPYTEEVDGSEDPGDLVESYDSLYEASAKEIDNQNLTAEEKLAALSLLNTDIATKIDSSIDDLIAELDNPASTQNRDSVQLEIQELDAIAADKRQEADRLNSQAELLAVNANPKDVQNQTPTNTDLEAKAGVPEKSVPDSDPIHNSVVLAEETIDTPDFSELTYKSLNANISFNKIQTQLDSSTAQREEARTLIEKINASPDASTKSRLAEQLDVLTSEIEKRDALIIENIANSNAAEIAYYQSDNNGIIAQIEAISASDRDGVNMDEFNTRSSELSILLADNETAFQKGEITKTEKIERDLELIQGLDKLNTQLDDIRDQLVPEVELADNESAEPAETKPATPLAVADGAMSQLEIASNYDPEPGHAYITPILVSFNAQMSDAQKLKYTSEVPELKPIPDFESTSDTELNVTLIQQATPIDAHGLALLKAQPEKLNYLTASIKADSLKKLELVKANYAYDLIVSGKEKLNEMNRLKSAISHEESPENRAQIQGRIDRLDAGMKVNFEEASIAAYQAEDLRDMRKIQEGVIAEAVADMKSADLAELNAILENKTYTVVSSDLASTEIHEPPAKEKPAPVLPPKSTPEVEPKAVTPVTEPVEAVYVPVTGNRNVNSIDEQILLEANGGNWLNVFEVIADKKDFSDVKESLFVDTDKPVYSDSKPIPLNATLPNGLVFQVQVGAFRNKIPQDLFGQFAPVMGEKLDNGITRYRAGVFSKYRNAVEARNTIREKGYSDAFVVAYINGERLTGAQAQDILRQAIAKDKEENPELAASNPINGSPKQGRTDNLNKIATVQPANIDYYSDPEAAQATQVEVTPGLFFTVQVGVYSKPVKLDKLYNLVQLNSELTASGYIRYTSGRYASVNAASSRKAEVIEKGVSDAFITAYYNGKRISLSKAEELLKAEGNGILSDKIGTETQPHIGGTPVKLAENQKTKPNPDAESQKKDSDNTKYVIILGSYAGDVPQSVANVFLERPDLKVRRVTAPNGVSIYASPEFDTREEAEDFLQLSRKAGVHSAIMGEVVNGKLKAVTPK